MSSFKRDEVAAYEQKAKTQNSQQLAPEAAAAASKSAGATKNNEQSPSEAPSASEDTGTPAEISGDDASAVDAALATATSEDYSAEDDAGSAPADEDTDSDGVDEDGTDGDGADANQRKPGQKFQKRIDTLVSQREVLKASLAQRDEVIAKLLAAHQNGGAPAPAAAAAPAVTPSDDPAPKLEQFDFDTTKWADAHAAWSQRQIERGVTAGINRLQTQQSAQAAQQAFEARTNAFKQSAPDFDVVVSNPALPPLHPTAARLVVTNEKGPAIVYHLAKNPEQLARIARLTPEQQAMAIGRIEASINAPKTAAVRPSQKNVTKAPAPPRTAPAGGSPGRNPNDTNVPMQDFVSQHYAQKPKARQPKR